MRYDRCEMIQVFASRLTFIGCAVRCPIAGSHSALSAARTRENRVRIARTLANREPFWYRSDFHNSSICKHRQVLMGFVNETINF